MERSRPWLVAAGIFLGTNEIQAQKFNPRIKPDNYFAADSSSATKPKPEPEPYLPPEQKPYTPPTQTPTKDGNSDSKTKSPAKNDNPAK